MKFYPAESVEEKICHRDDISIKNNKIELRNNDDVYKLILDNMNDFRWIKL